MQTPVLTSAQVTSTDFPTLLWTDVLTNNVLAAYFPQDHTIRINRYFYNDYMAEPIVLRLVMLHELLHSFQFGSSNATKRQAQWTADFDTADPGISGHHWTTSASDGYHVRTRLHAQAELMQPILNGMSHLTMASLVCTDKSMRYACERDADCSGARKFCVHESDRWVGVCSLHRSSEQDHGVVVLSVVIVLVVLLATITAVVLIPTS